MVLQKKPTRENAYNHICPLVHAYGGSLIAASSKASLPLTTLVSTFFYSKRGSMGRRGKARKDDDLQGSHRGHDYGRCLQSQASRASRTWRWAVLALKPRILVKMWSCTGGRVDRRL